MSSRSRKIYVGNLPPDVVRRDLEDLFDKFGPIAEIDLKNNRGPPFAFVEFEDDRDAQDAIKSRDGYKFSGYSLRVEFPRSSGFAGGGRGGRGGFGDRRGGYGSGPPSRRPSRRSEYRVMVTGMPASGSWQDLKDHMREVGEVGYADVRNGIGYVEFMRYEDMRNAIKKLDDAKFKSHEGESAYIRVKEDRGNRQPEQQPHYSRRSVTRSRSRSLSRSRSPPPRRRASPTYSPMRNGGGSGGRGKSRSRSPSRSRSVSRSVSRSRSRSRS